MKIHILHPPLIEIECNQSNYHTNYRCLGAIWENNPESEVAVEVGRPYIAILLKCGPSSLPQFF